MLKPDHIRSMFMEPFMNNKDKERHEKNKKLNITQHQLCCFVNLLTDVCMVKIRELKNWMLNFFEDMNICLYLKNLADMQPSLFS